MRKWGMVVAALGVLLLAGAAMLRFVVVPNGQVLPSDTDEKIVYAGALTSLNAEALESGDLQNVMNRDVPMTVERHVQVLDTDGDKARVSDAAVVTAKGSGEVVSDTESFYTLDRGTLMAIPNFTDKPAEDAEGLVIGYPVNGVDKVDYIGWVDDVQQTSRSHFAGEDEVRGLPVYKFSGEFSTELSAAEVPGGMTTMPKEQLAGMVAALGLPASVQKQLADALPALPDQIPLTYTYKTSNTNWVEPKTGMIVDMDRTTGTYVAPTGLSDEQFPVYEMTVTYTPQNIADEVTEAQDNVDQLRLYGTTIPIVLTALGVVGLVVGLVMVRRRPEKEVPPPPATREREPVLTG